MKNKRRQHSEGQEKKTSWTTEEEDKDEDKRRWNRKRQEKKLTRVEVETVIGVNILEKKKIQYNRIE